VQKAFNSNKTKEKQFAKEFCPTRYTRVRIKQSSGNNAGALLLTHNPFRKTNLPVTHLE
jgi:hypothetical protein